MQKIKGLKLYRHDETPSEQTGVLVIGNDNGELWFDSINEWGGNPRAWDNPIPDGYFFVVEEEFFNGNPTGQQA